MASATPIMRIGSRMAASIAVVMSVFVMIVLYQVGGVLSTPIGENSRIAGKYSALQEPVGSCPSEHSTPPCRGDTLGASGAVADVVGEASDGHCVALLLCMLPLYIYYRHKSSPAVRYSETLSKYSAAFIPTSSSNFNRINVP